MQLRESSGCCSGLKSTLGAEWTGNARCIPQRVQDRKSCRFMLFPSLRADCYAWKELTHNNGAAEKMQSQNSGSATISIGWLKNPRPRGRDESRDQKVLDDGLDIPSSHIKRRGRK